MGNLKTLTPGPQTLTTGRVRGLPTDRSADYHYGPLYRPPPKLRLKEKNRNKDFTYFLSTAIEFTRVEISSGTLGKCNRPEFSLGWNLYH